MSLSPFPWPVWRPPLEALFTETLAGIRDRPPYYQVWCDPSLELWSLKAVTKKLGTQMSSGSYMNHLLVPSGPGVGQILHSQWTLNLITMHSVLWLLPFQPLGRFLPPQPSLLTYKCKLLSTARRFQESPASICGDLHLRQSPDFQPVGSRPQSHRWDVHLCMFYYQTVTQKTSDHMPPTGQGERNTRTLRALSDWCGQYRELGKECFAPYWKENFKCIHS